MLIHVTTTSFVCLYIKGVVVRSLLGLALANIFVDYNAKKLFFITRKPSIYFRYVSFIIASAVSTVGVSPIWGYSKFFVWFEATRNDKTTNNNIKKLRFLMQNNV